MTAGELAALIAAGFFAAGMCAAVYVLVKLAKLISAATAVLDGYRDGAENLLRRANAAVARADEQLARTGALADSVDQVSGAMSELSDEVTAVARTARLIATGLGAPALRVAAIGHGIRHAMALRSGARRTVRQLPARERAGR
jgi:ABC-type transporter Mla subunit MlaD